MCFLIFTKTLPYFKVTGVLNSFNWKCCVLIWLSLSWNFVRLLTASSRSWIQHNIDFRNVLDIIDMFTRLKYTFKKKKKKTFMLAFSRTRLKQYLSTFLGVDIVILGLMTLTLFQGHRCVRNIYCKLRALDSCLL